MDSRIDPRRINAPTRHEGRHHAEPIRIASQAAGAGALALALLLPAQAAPLLEMTTWTSLDGVALNVYARDLVGVASYQFTLNFDPALLTAVRSTGGSFLSGAGPTFFNTGDINNTTGTITDVLGRLTVPNVEVSGSGHLATFTFDVKQIGLANFRLSDVMVLDSAGTVLTVDVRNLVTDVPEPATVGMFALGLFALFGARMYRHAESSTACWRLSRCAGAAGYTG